MTGEFRILVGGFFFFGGGGLFGCREVCYRVLRLKKLGYNKVNLR